METRLHLPSSKRLPLFGLVRSAPVQNSFSNCASKLLTESVRRMEVHFSAESAFSHFGNSHCHARAVDCDSYNKTKPSAQFPLHFWRFRLHFLSQHRSMTRQVFFMAVAILCCHVVAAQLSSSFYSKTCPNALSIVKSAVTQAVNKEKRMGASLLRLHFHDCFVNGCDASILLDDNATFTGEKTAGPNSNSVRGFDVVDTIKSNLESSCAGVVSCADILAIAARDSVVALGGPSWTVLLGRRDSTTASLSTATSDIPSPASSLSTLISAFQKKGLSTKQMIALSGAHTIGQGRCTSFRSRIYNDTNIDATFAASKKQNCPSTGSDGNLSPIDVQTSTAFDNAYYKNLQSKKGLFHSDQELFNNGSADSQVNTYASSQATFFSDFTSAMISMGNVSPLTGSSGQIRTNCRKVN